MTAPDHRARDEQPAECPTPFHHPLTICPICHPGQPAVDYDTPTLAEREQAEEDRAAQPVPANRWMRESTAIANSGRCTCTDDESCWDHEALEMQAEDERLNAPPAPAGDDELREAIDRLADPTLTPAVRLMAAGIARNEAEMQRRELERLREENAAARVLIEGRDGQLRDVLEQNERLRVELGRAQALSSADPAAIAELRAENATLRARDEKVAAVVRLLGGIHCGAWFAGTDLGAALDELARAHREAER